MRLIRVKFVLVNLNPINDTYIGKLNVGRISVKPISRSRILIHFTFFGLGQSVEKVDPATVDPFKSIFSFGEKSQLISVAIFCDFLRIFADFCDFLLVNQMNTGKRLERTFNIYSLQRFPSLLGTVKGVQNRHSGKLQNDSSTLAIFCDFFLEIKLNTGKRLERTFKIYSLEWFPF